jgi:hypothetical protein
MLRKLLIIIMGIFLVLCAGSCNLYPLYIKQMKDKFGYSITEVNLYGSFINLGLWAAFTMGFVYDKWGPKISCIIGAVLLCGSYSVLYLIMNSSLTSLSIVPMLILALIMGQGSALCYTTAVTTNLKNFRIKETSLIVGLLVANLAISPSIFTTYREALKDVVDIANYFLIIATFLAVIIVICGFVFTNIRNLYSDQLAEFEKYKEKKVIILLVILNIFTLMVYTFGVVFNNLKSDSRFPNIIVYPCLQSLNFTFIVLEQCGFFEKIYFKIFIEKKLKHKMVDEEKRTEGVVQKIQDEVRDMKGFTDEVEIKYWDRGNKSFRESKIKYENIELGNVDRKNNTMVEGNFGLDNFRNYIERNLNKHNDGGTHMLDADDGEIKEEQKEEPMDVIDDIDKRNKEMIAAMEVSNVESKDVSQFEQKDITKDEPKEESTIDNKQEVTNELPAVDHDFVEDDEDKGLTEFQKFIKIIKSHELLLLFSIFILGIGSVISNLNNIEFIVIAVTTTPTSKVISEYAIVYFVFNSFSRILSGILLDKLIKWGKFYHFLILLSCIGFVSQILGIIMDREILFLSLALAGLTHGGYMTFAPIYTRTKFGLNNMGKILGFLTTGCAVGSLFVADLIFPIFYDIYVEEEKCLGKRCFRGAYIITSCFFMINIVLAVILYRKNKKIG